jgi:tRNA 2-selenouridine synthase
VTNVRIPGGGFIHALCSPNKPTYPRTTKTNYLHRSNHNHTLDIRKDPAAFLTMSADRPVLDVRSPGEFNHGHIPGAISFPLFTDDERAQVGTFYKQKGGEPAFILGLQFVGPKMAGFVQSAIKLAPGRKVAVHCWRGGQRSGSMAWLLQQAGFDVVTMAGGYKAYRNHVLHHFAEQRLDLRIVGGKTGTGKTKILHALRDLGEQIIDLEGIACHKGSAFGFIGERPQPTVEQFENDLHQVFEALDPARPVWLENESHSIGRVFIPDGLWGQMKTAPLFHVEIPEPDRIRNLLADYVIEHTADLQLAFQKIASKLGGLRLKNALAALQEGDFAAAATIALEYYDKTYQHCLDNNVSPDIRKLLFEHGDAVEIARNLVAIDK